MNAKSSAPRAPRAPRAKKTKSVPAEAAVVLNHVEFIEDAGESALNDLIASLNAPADEIVEPVTSVVDDVVLDAAVSGAEAIDASILFATPEGVVDAGAVPTGDASDVVATKTKTPKAAKTPKKPKPAAVPRKHYADKTERLKDKLGAGLVDYSVLTLADAGVSEAELGAVMETTMGIIRAMNKKEANWAVKFIEYMAGKKASLSEVTSRIFKVLERDGAITTGNDGNVFKDLIARPYSAGSARAMGGNNIGMLVDLKVILADGKGRFVANPESLLLMKVKSMLTAAPVIMGEVGGADSVLADKADEAETVGAGEEDGEMVETADEGELVAA